MQKRVLIFFMCYLLSAGLFQLISALFFLNITDSLPLGLYLRVPATYLSKGDYIIYEPTEEVRKIVVDYGWGDGKHLFLKKIGAVAGEHYTIREDNGEFWIEGQHYGQVFLTDTKGQPLPKLQGEFIIPTGHVLPVATNPRSFDGRYTGSIPIDHIKAKVIPLFIP